MFPRSKESMIRLIGHRMGKGRDKGLKISSSKDFRKQVDDGFKIVVYTWPGRDRNERSNVYFTPSLIDPATV